MDEFLAAVLPLLFIFAISIGAAALMAAAERASKRAHLQNKKELGIDVKKDTKCPPHKWSHRESDGKLQCTRYDCQMVAGENKLNGLFQ